MMNESSKSITDTLNGIGLQLFGYLPLACFVLGLIGFWGNLFTYLQREFRKNTCSIYNLAGSIVDIITISVNQLPSYIGFKYGLFIPWYSTSSLCKLNIFLLVFLPHLSVNFLLMSIIDRFACTCPATSPFYKLNRLKAVPWMIGITIVVTGLTSLYAPMLFDLVFPMWCSSTQSTTTSVLYIILIGLLSPILMLLFVILTYRNIHQSRRRVTTSTPAAQPHRAQKHLIIIAFAQILVTALLTLQWIVFYIYTTATSSTIRTFEDWSIVGFAMSVTNNVFYLNNVKSFYISLLISRLFRQTFIKSLLKCIPPDVCSKLELAKTVPTNQTATKARRVNLMTSQQQ